MIGLFTHSSEEVALQHSHTVADALSFLVADIKNLNSIRVLITKARENARGVQDNITKEVWEQVNQLYHIVNEPGLTKKITGSRALDVIDLLNRSSIQFYGVTDSTMPRGQGWNFMNAGKFIERCLMTIDTAGAHFRKINAQANTPLDILVWRNLLLSLSGYELYLKTYTRGQHNTSVIDHVIFNRDFPRSLAYSLQRVKVYLDKIAEDTKMEGSSALQRMFGRIYSKVEFTDMQLIQEMTVPKFLQSLRNDLVEFSNQLTRIYFSYA